MLFLKGWYIFTMPVLYKVSTTYRVFAFMMAFWMSFMSFGVAVDMHFCGDELKSTSFFGEAEKCDMHKGDNSTCTKHTKFEERVCCRKKKPLKRTCCHKSKSENSAKMTCHQSEAKEGSGEASISHKGCCHNEQFKFELDEDFVKDDAFFLQITDYTAIVDCLPVLLSYIIFNEETSENIPEVIPPPPLPEIDLLATVQCYRI